MPIAALRGVLTRARLPVARALLSSAAPRIKGPPHAPKLKGRNWTRDLPAKNPSPERVDKRPSRSYDLSYQVPASVLHIRRDAAMEAELQRWWIPPVFFPRLRRTMAFMVLLLSQVWRPQRPRYVSTLQELQQAELRHTDLGDGVTRGWDAPTLLPPAGTPVTEETRKAAWAQLKCDLPLQFQFHQADRQYDAWLRYCIILQTTAYPTAEYAMHTAVFQLYDRFFIGCRVQRLLHRYPAGWSVSDEQRLALAREMMEDNVEDARCILALNAVMLGHVMEDKVPGLVDHARLLVKVYDTMINADDRSLAFLARGTADAATSDAYAFAEHARDSLRLMLDDTKDKHGMHKFARHLTHLSWAATRLGHSAAAVSYALRALQICITREYSYERTRMQLRVLLNCPMDSPVLRIHPVGPQPRDEICAVRRRRLRTSKGARSCAKTSLPPGRVLRDSSIQAFASRLTCDPDARAPCDIEEAVDADAVMLRVLFRLADALRAVERVEEASAVHTVAEQRRARLVRFVAKHAQATEV